MVNVTNNNATDYVSGLNKGDVLDFDAAQVSPPDCPYERLKSDDRACPIKLRRRTGHRLDFQCGAYIASAHGGGHRCESALSITLALQGWAGGKGRGNVNLTKAAVLGVLADGLPRTTSQIAEEGGLSPGVVIGFLSRAVVRQYVIRSAERELMAVGRAYTYELAPRGVLWLDWWAENAPA